MSAMWCEDSNCGCCCFLSVIISSMCEDLKIYVYRRKESLLEVVPATLRHPHVVPTNLTRNLAMSRTLGTRVQGLFCLEDPETPKPLN